MTIRYEYSDDLSINDGACLIAGDDGWMTAHLPNAGEYRLQATPGALLPGGDDCPASARTVTPRTPPGRRGSG